MHNKFSKYTNGTNHVYTVKCWSEVNKPENHQRLTEWPESRVEFACGYVQVNSDREMTLSRLLELEEKKKAKQ